MEQPDKGPLGKLWAPTDHPPEYEKRLRGDEGWTLGKRFLDQALKPAAPISKGVILWFLWPPVHPSTMTGADRRSGSCGILLPNKQTTQTTKPPTLNRWKHNLLGRVFANWAGHGGMSLLRRYPTLVVQELNTFVANHTAKACGER